MSHQKDTDYLALSAWIRARENDLLTRERLDRMIDAKDHSEAVKVLTQCGYPEPEGLTQGSLEGMLARERQNTFRELTQMVPDPRVVEIFQLKYDYHNGKTLVKGRGQEVSRLLVQGGRYDPRQLEEDFRREDLGDTSPLFREGVAAALEEMAQGGDPQLADLALDGACFAEMAQLARATGSPFLMSYVATAIDVANLRTAVRVMRIRREREFLARALLPGGTVDPQDILEAKGSALGELYRGSLMEQAGELAAVAVGPEGGSLTQFERACDNALTACLEGAKAVPSGEQVVVAYLHAKDSELTAVRTVLSGRLAGLEGEVIRARLRDTYV